MIESSEAQYRFIRQEFERIYGRHNMLHFDQIYAHYMQEAQKQLRQPSPSQIFQWANQQVTAVYGLLASAMQARQQTAMLSYQAQPMQPAYQQQLSLQYQAQPSPLPPPLSQQNSQMQSQYSSFPGNASGFNLGGTGGQQGASMPFSGPGNVVGYSQFAFTSPHVQAPSYGQRQHNAMPSPQSTMPPPALPMLQESPRPQLPPMITAPPPQAQPIANEPQETAAQAYERARRDFAAEQEQKQKAEEAQAALRKLEAEKADIAREFEAYKANAAREQAAREHAAQEEATQGKEAQEQAARDEAGRQETARHQGDLTRTAEENVPAQNNTAHYPPLPQNTRPPLPQSRRAPLPENTRPPLPPLPAWQCQEVVLPFDAYPYVVGPQGQYAIAMEQKFLCKISIQHNYMPPELATVPESRRCHVSIEPSTNTTGNRRLSSLEAQIGQCASFYTQYGKYYQDALLHNQEPLNTEQWYPIRDKSSEEQRAEWRNAPSSSQQVQRFKRGSRRGKHWSVLR